MKLPSYTPQHIHIADVDRPTYSGLGYRMLATVYKSKSPKVAQYQSQTTPGYAPNKAYTSSVFPRGHRRRPRRISVDLKNCTYCGYPVNDKPVIAMAVNSTGRLVNIGRLSAPHCSTCGKKVA